MRKIIVMKYLNSFYDYCYLFFSIQTKLLNGLNKRKIELKCMVDNEIKIAKSNFNENILKFNDLQKKNNYYIGLTETVINQGKTSDVIMLSK